ncbi:MAG TPA: extracellular solute-binding protein [Bacillales bacterium]|nr:extracellular solute-binding protein [Bacillales bacterium]
MKKKFSLLAALLVVLSMVLAACGGSGGSSETSGDSGSSGGSGGSGEVKLEIFSWWTAGGEADALKAFLNGFKDKYSKIKVENAAVAGGGGSNAKAVLATRMQGGDPPSTFQVHGGAELFQYVKAGKMQPLDELYKKNGWKEKFPKKVIEMNSMNGHVYGVPIDIHRGNVLWYNKSIFEKYNLQPPKTFEDFFNVAKKLKQHGITPLALGDKNGLWGTMLFENILLAKLGPDKYAKLWTGDVPFDSQGVRDAAETFKKMLNYINTDHSSLAWQDATQRVIDGKAAMNEMGDWAEGYFVSKGWKPKKDFGWIEAPGTTNDFMIVNDSFGLPKGVKHPDAVKKFLTYVGSVKGEDIFNPIKGSIPPRLDADKSQYNVYSKSTMEDFQADTKSHSLALSLSNGSAAPPGFLTKVNTAITAFETQKDVDQLIQQLKQASSLLK